MRITQEEFIRYEIVREEGEYNMFDSRAIAKTRIPRDRYIHLISNYDKYARQWNS